MGLSSLMVLGLSCFLAQADPVRRISNGNGNSVAFSSDGRWLAWTPGTLMEIGDPETNCIKIWDLKANKRLRIIDLPPGTWAERVVFSPDSKLIATADGQKSVRVWEVQSGKLLKDLKAPDEDPYNPLNEVCFSSDGSIVFAGGDKGWIFSWDVKDGKSRPSIKTDLQTNNFLIPPDSKWAIVGAGLGATVWNITTGEKGFDLTDPKVVEAYKEGDIALPNPAVAMNKSRYLVAVDSEQPYATPPERVVYVWDFQKRSLLYTIRAPSIKPAPSVLQARGLVKDLNPHRVAFHPDGESLATINPKGQVSVWNVSTQKEIQTLPIEGVRDLAYSVDGKTLAVVALKLRSTDDVMQKRNAGIGGGIYLCSVKSPDKK